MRETRAAILAAGKGTRMKSALPKMVQNVAGKPMVRYVADACRSADIGIIYVIVGGESKEIKKALGGGFHYVLQQPQLGTGHALMQLVPLLNDYQGDLLALVGDSPFITSQILQKLIARHRDSGAAATFITTVFDEPPLFGRIVRNCNGKVQKITEAKDASPQILAIKEVNTSHYCFKAETVLPLLSKINNDNAQGEYYLTDIIEILVNENHSVETIQEADNRIVFGINSRKDLTEAVSKLQR